MLNKNAVGWPHLFFFFSVLFFYTDTLQLPMIEHVSQHPTSCTQVLLNYVFNIVCASWLWHSSISLSDIINHLKKKKGLREIARGSQHQLLNTWRGMEDLKYRCGRWTRQLLSPVDGVGVGKTHVFPLSIFLLSAGRCYLDCYILIWLVFPHKSRGGDYQLWNYQSSNMQKGSMLTEWLFWNFSEHITAHQSKLNQSVQLKTDIQVTSPLSFSWLKKVWSFALVLWFTIKICYLEQRMRASYLKLNVLLERSMNKYSCSRSVSLVAMHW